MRTLACDVADPASAAQEPSCPPAHTGLELASLTRYGSLDRLRVGIGDLGGQTRMGVGDADRNTACECVRGRLDSSVDPERKDGGDSAATVMAGG
jgi:hypothetical protein